MAVGEVVHEDAVVRPARRRLLVLKRVPVIPLAIIALIVLTALLANVLTPYSPTDISLSERLRPPFWEQGGSLAHPLGTDPMGRDLLTRMIYGARVSLVVGFLGLFVGGGVGAALGMIAGYMGGRMDTFLMRVVDTTLAFPIILFAILLVVILGGSLVTVVIAVALVLWARYARVIRGEVLSLRERDFVAQARIAGCSSGRIILVHIFPNVLNTLVVLLSLQVGWVIIVEASLSFLGAGVPPPTPTWGSMIAEGRDYIASAWWVSFFPGLAILVTVLAFNLCGDWLRDALDPTMRQM
ncbi:MAG TPA: ABC transporter permease [Candidatus Tectomicrobia bacterium]|jgi:peptide/nickel transport system permease protein